jgi:hypothetical protein
LLTIRLTIGTTVVEYIMCYITGCVVIYIRLTGITIIAAYQRVCERHNPETASCIPTRCRVHDTRDRMDGLREFDGLGVPSDQAIHQQMTQECGAYTVP